MSMDFATVIVPTRHRPDYVDVAIRSILTSAAELERAHGVATRVVVVDDAPDTDDTEQVARRLGVDYLRVMVHDGLADPGAAIALGVRNVQTEYQTIFGDDDIMLPRHMTAAYEKLLEGYDVVSCSFTLTDAKLKVAQTRILEPTDVGDLIAGHTLVNDGSFVKHELVAELDWDVTLEGQMLVPIWGHLMIQGRRFGLVQEPTWLYRRHDANISSGALSPHDLALREKARARLADEAREVLGHVPPSPYEAKLAADREAQERRRASRQTKQAAAARQKSNSTVDRVRRRLARAIAP